MFLIIFISFLGGGRHSTKDEPIKRMELCFSFHQIARNVLYVPNEDYTRTTYVRPNNRASCVDVRIQGSTEYSR